MPIRAAPAHKQLVRPIKTFAQIDLEKLQKYTEYMFKVMYTLNKHRYQKKEGHGN